MLDVHFSVVGLSETWLNSDTLGLYELDGYKSIHLARLLEKVAVFLYILVEIMTIQKTPK